MAQYYAIINNETRIPLFRWSAQELQATGVIHFATDDLSFVRQALSEIEIINVYTDTDEEVGIFSQFDGYSSITYLGINYSEQLNGFGHEMTVTLTQTDIIETMARTVDRLNNQINPVIDIDSMTLEKYKEYKVAEFSKRGEQIIFAGTDVELGDGSVKNFTYNLEDQSNLLNALFIIGQLEDYTITLPYHSHGEPCELYSALDIIRIYLQLSIYSTTYQTLVNMKNNWVRSCQTKEEAMEITFESDLPAEWIARAQAVLLPTQQLVEIIRQKFFPETSNEEPVEEENE